MERYTLAVFILLVFLNITLAFYQPFSTSLFGDEGQYLLIAKKMLDGWVPYRDIIENKPIGMYLSLIPAVLLGGKDIVKLRLYGALIVSLTSFFIFLIGSRVNKWTGLISAFVYICMEALPGFYGYLLMTEPVANLFLVILFYLLLSKKQSYPNFFLIGILAAISLSIKQNCIFVFAPLIFAVYTQKMDKKKIIAASLCGVGVVMIPMILYLVLNSAFWDAVYWCVYTSIRFGGSELDGKIGRLVDFSYFFLPFILLAVVTIRSLTKEKKIIWLWLLSALAMVQVGYSWFHYYLLLAPPLSILAAMGGAELRKLGSTKGRFVKVYHGTFIFLVVISLLLISFEIGTILKLGRSEKSYEKQWEISEFISSHTNKDDGIFVFLCDSYIYYLTDRRPVSKMTFFWFGYLRFMSDAEKNEFIFEPLEKNKPKYVVMNPLIYESDSTVVRVRDYLNEMYEHVGDWGPYQLYERKTE